MATTGSISRWALAATVLVGAAAGIGAYTFRYAQGLSYFSADPAACANCHIMNPQLDSWQHGSHHAVAVCVDCHLPQDFVPKYLAKAEAGYRHSEKFTTQNFVEPIVVQEEGRAILQANCVRCHSGMVHNIESVGTKGELACTHCHVTAGHGERTGLGPPLARDNHIDQGDEDRTAHGN